MATSSLSDFIRAEALALGFDLVGLAPLRASDHAAFYRAWIEAGRHGAMGYLARPDAVAARTDPRAAWPELASAVVVAHNYHPGGDEDAADDPARAVVARYARGRDYHKVLKKKLLALLRRIEEETGTELPAARAYVDTGPVLERELARRAGLGWFGRNTMLISPRRGSYLFLGSLLLPFELEYDAPFEADRCGSCTACVDACPTGALLGRDADGAPVMDATRCISYLTIEQRGAIPVDLREKIGNRVYGCDICQEVCPFSRKFSEQTREPSFAARGPGEPPFGVEALEGDVWHPGTDSPSLVDLMRMSREEWDVWTRGSAIRRAGYAGFKRNVAVAMGNWLAGVDEPPVEAVAVLREALEDEEALVREHVAWALERIVAERSSGSARDDAPGPRTN